MTVQPGHTTTTTDTRPTSISTAPVHTSSMTELDGAAARHPAPPLNPSLPFPSYQTSMCPLPTAVSLYPRFFSSLDRLFRSCSCAPFLGIEKCVVRRSRKKITGWNNTGLSGKRFEICMRGKDCLSSCLHPKQVTISAPTDFHAGPALSPGVPGILFLSPPAKARSSIVRESAAAPWGVRSTSCKSRGIVRAQNAVERNRPI